LPDWSDTQILPATLSAMISAVTPPELADASALPPMREKETLLFDDQFDIRINWFLPADINHLFNEADFFRLHTNSCSDIYAQLTRVSDGRVFATICFYDCGNHEFVSPSRGTFGGVSTDATLSPHRLEAFVVTMTDYLSAAGAKSLRMKLPPLTHDVAQISTLCNILSRRGWVATTNDLNFDLRVDASPLSHRLEHGNAKRLRKCIRDDFESNALSLDALDAAYAVVSANRTRRGHPMTMTFPQVATMRALFPEKMFLFGVSRPGTSGSLAAAAICLAVRPDVLYVLYWGDADEMETYSPIVLLASEIYRFCQQRHYVLLDAGISTVEGVPNEGLVNFKRRLGFSASLKPTYSKVL
jgi:hypothetical protein